MAVVHHRGNGGGCLEVDKLEGYHHHQDDEREELAEVLAALHALIESRGECRSPAHGERERHGGHHEHQNHFQVYYTHVAL